MQDTEDWARIVSEHGPAGWRAAYRLLGNEADAADCLQDAFVAAVELARRQEVRSWGGLLQRLVTTKAIDRLRQRFRQAARLQSWPSTLEPAAGDPSPHESAEAAELADELRRALCELPAQQATVFCMHCQEDFSCQEISRSLDITPGNTATLLHRARASLRALLKVSPARDSKEVRHD